MSLLTRPEHIVHFFRDVHEIHPITKQITEPMLAIQKLVDLVAASRATAAIVPKIESNRKLIAES